MIKGQYLILLGGSWLVISTAAIGESVQDENQNNVEVSLDELDVWTTQVQASSVYLQDDAILSKQADHISDLLRTIPGVDVGGAHSLNQRITIRSMDDKDLRITIDGANQNTYMYHHMGNLQIHADILQSVDIDIGNNSIINGGLGGAVRFETKTARQLLEPGQRFGARAQVSYADNASKNYSLTGYGQVTDQVDILAYYNSVKRDNYQVGGGEIKDPDGNEIPGTDGEVKGLEGDLTDGLIKFGWDISDSQRLSVGYENYEDKGDYSYRPDMGLATDLAISNNLNLPLTFDTEFLRETYTLNYDLDWGENNSLRATLFNNKSTMWRDETAVAEIFPGDPGIVEGEATNSGINILATSVIEAGWEHELTYGLERIRYKTQYTADGVDSSDEEVINTALYLEDKIHLSQDLALIPGIRYDHYRIDSQVVDDSYKRFSAALAFEYQLARNLQLRAGSTQLFKGPEIGEVFIGAGLFDKPNPDINAETGYNSELSLAFEDKIFGAERFSAGMTLFNTRIEDYIYDYATPPPSVGGRGWKDNIGDMEINGFEAYLGYDLGNLRTLFTFSRAESDLDAFTQYAELDGARLDRQQGNTFSLNVDYLIPPYHLALHWDMLHVDDVDAGLDLDGASLDNAKDGYTVHNISARWTPKQIKGLTLTLGIDNLFDEYYASQSSRTGVSFHPRFGELYLLDYEPGRNVKMTLSYQL